MTGIRPDPALEGEGWELRFLADPVRAEEAAELYRSLGLEVLCRTVTAIEFGPACAACAETACRSYRTIYTRKPAPADC